MKKNYSLILFVALFISNAFGLITNLIPPTVTTNNFNNTGVIHYEEYNSDLDIDSNTIKIYNYIDLTSKDAPKIDIENLELNDNSFENIEPNSISILIPRKIEFKTKTSKDESQDILSRMYNYVNLQNAKLKLQTTSELVLNAIESNLLANKLENSFDTQKKAKLASAILGSHALFMPRYKSTIERFNGISRVLSTPITCINDLLLKNNDFANNKSITGQQIASLQNLIFQEMQKAGTVVFIPECMSNKVSANQETSGSRLPVAIINTIDLNSEDHTIKIEFLTSKTAKNNFDSCHLFIQDRELLFQHEANTDDKWEFINYTFKIGYDVTNEFNKCYQDLSIYYYQVSNINIEANGTVNTQLHKATNNRTPQNITPLSSELPSYTSNSESNLNSSSNQEQHRLSQATLPSAEDLKNIFSNDELQYKNYFDKNASPCDHYKRNCLVKIQGDDKFYPCHRCHNNTKGGSSKKKSKDVIELKCLKCGHEQAFDKESGNKCLTCGIKFAEYYCDICKHLLATKEQPYHCEQCGICRVHGDRSFHCDVCGVCLDVNLKGNHKCRAGSAHDACCICLEDAFAGCQILHCSHKVHKECLVNMIRSGITRCPICKESFADKLERNPLQNRTSRNELPHHVLNSGAIEPNDVVNTPQQDRTFLSPELPSYTSNSESNLNNSFNQEQHRLSQATLPSAEDLKNIFSNDELQYKNYFDKNASPCDHYKRNCLVKIQGDDKFYPCHRCHNNTKGGSSKKKSKDVIELKCLKCGHEQAFDKESGNKCLTCGIKFAEYYCDICKHLLATKEQPYHCEQCGICRVHGDRSFHCDVCGVCLDVNLKGNHKCRAGSAHDACCICLEDAFAGCQILPCSHKVHKECLVNMIRSGITRCPICKESFADKLERNPLQNRTSRNELPHHVLNSGAIEPNDVVNTPQQDRTFLSPELPSYTSNSESNLNSSSNQEQHRLSQATLPSAEDLKNIFSKEELQYKIYFDKNASPCDHYKRNCLVKIQGDNKFYPCHRCYNNIKRNSSGKKAKDVIELKCLQCKHEQIFDKETGHSCLACGIKFSEYYCGICKHLTDMVDQPYHCDKCGICRIHGDRSFHCDVCGGCLDVNLRGNHKCREGSAHDPCCICYEDAFTGCRILPCSHRVHQECATKMIKEGITRCPLCGESFAHKLKRRPLSFNKKKM